MERERSANRTGRSDAELYSSHRERLTDLLVRFAGPRKRLCLLGAGNCNDVDLPTLLEVYAEVHLVDLDAEAVDRATSRLPARARQRVRAHAPVDLSGVLAHWHRLVGPDGENALEPSTYAAALLPIISASTVDLLTRLPGPFDVAVSCCVTTQMAVALAGLMGERHPCLPALRLAIMRVHMRTLAGLAVPGQRGGVALWVTDVTSSSLHPMESTPAPQSHWELYRRAIAAGAVYPSGDPRTMDYVLRTDPVLAGVRLAEAYDPWLWSTRHRTFLVSALRYST